MWTFAISTLPEGQKVGTEELAAFLLDMYSIRSQWIQSHSAGGRRVRQVRPRRNPYIDDRRKTSDIVDFPLWVEVGHLCLSAD